MLASMWLDVRWRGGIVSDRPFPLAISAAFALLVVLLLEKYGGYRPSLSLLAVRETECALRATLVAVLLALPLSAVPAQFDSRRLLAPAVVILPFLLLLERWQVQRLIGVMRDRMNVTQKAVIIGTGPLARRIFSTLVQSPKLGIKPVGLVETDANVTNAVIHESSYKPRYAIEVLGGPINARLLRKLGVNIVIIAAPEMAVDEVAALRGEAEAAGISTYVSPEAFLQGDGAVGYMELDGVLLAHRCRRCEQRTYQIAKRTLDTAIAGTFLLLCAPLLAAAAIAIKLTSAGPVFFRQQRVGQHGLVFTMYKFRTMYSDCARYEISPVNKDDTRITPVGRRLRHWCIDELPQLINVLRGEMSLVGPRPEMPFVVAQYEAIHRKRLTVKPGLTGLWQLSADRLSPIHHNIGYDLYYLQHRNLLMDIAILFHTAVFAFRGV